MTFGVQLFGASPTFRKDPQAFFARMQAAGITQIEPCILFDDPVAFKEKALAMGNTFAATFPDVLWLPQEVAAFAAELHNRGMTLSSAHVFAADLSACTQRLLETAKAGGITAYVVNVADWAKEDPQAFSRLLAQLAADLKTVGCELWLHNGQGTMTPMVEGQGLYEWIIRNTKGLYAQPDTGWLWYDGVEPYAFLENLGGFLRSVHFKDLSANFGEKTGAEVFAVLGQGCVRNAACFAFVKKGLPGVIDQDVSTGDFIADLEKSAAYLKSLA